MVVVRPFKAVRPKKELAEKVASFPYDVLNSKEAKIIAQDNEYSFLHVVKPEIDLDENINLYDDAVYQKAKENLESMIKNKVLIQDEIPLLYIYKQKMGTHEQYGIVSTVSADDYNNDIIKKHEFTRKDKEDDRTKHVLTLNANTGPVFLTYRDNNNINEIIENFVTSNTPEVDFTSEDGIGHTVWVINDENVILKIVDIFKNDINYMYVADGHHRSASAARAKSEKMKLDKDYNENKNYNFFLAVLFPATQLKIMDYNRVLFNMNGLSKDELFAKIKEKFNFLDENVSTPSQNKRFGMYIDGKWYQIEAKKDSYPKDPVKSLDVAILQDNLLSPIFGIGDPRTDKQIDFVGGIRGTKELERRVDSGECKVAFSMFPTSIEQLMSVADADKVMPPKSTWFEPKLRSGLFVNLIN
jgi:uncharacterized protein (DUF1015 family)